MWAALVAAVAQPCPRSSPRSTGIDSEIPDLSLAKLDQTRIWIRLRTEASRFGAWDRELRRIFYRSTGYIGIIGAPEPREDTCPPINTLSTIYITTLLRIFMITYSVTRIFPNLDLGRTHFDNAIDACDIVCSNTLRTMRVGGMNRGH